MNIQIVAWYFVIGILVTAYVFKKVKQDYEAGRLPEQAKEAYERVQAAASGGPQVYYVIAFLFAISWPIVVIGEAKAMVKGLFGKT